MLKKLTLFTTLPLNLVHLLSFKKNKMSVKAFIKSKQFFFHLSLSLITLVVLFVLLYFFVLGYTRHDNKTLVPSFIGLKYKALDKVKGYDDVDIVITDSVYDPTLPKGIVLEQTPAPSAIVKSGRTIYLSVNAYSAKKIKMPNVVGLSLREAGIRLELYGLRIGKIKYVPELPNVLEQWYNAKPIAPNAEVEQGASIDLVIGKGFGEEKIINPDLFRLPKTDVDAILKANNLILGLEFFDSGCNAATAVAYRQSPKANGHSTIKPGTAVDVWYCDPSDPKLDEVASEKALEKDFIDKSLNGGGAMLDQDGNFTNSTLKPDSNRTGSGKDSTK
jgi:beta-lactam-binding protein with PASTA domain